MDEVIDGILTGGIRVLHLEETCRHIQHSLLGIHLLASHTDSINKVCLTTTGGSEHEEGVERRLTWVLRDRETYRARQLIAVTLDKGLESLMDIQLGIQVLWDGGIQRGRRLVGSCGRLRTLDIDGLTALFLDRQLVCLVHHNTVVELDTLTKAAAQHLT